MFKEGWKDKFMSIVKDKFVSKLYQKNIHFESTEVTSGSFQVKSNELRMKDHAGAKYNNFDDMINDLSDDVFDMGDVGEGDRGSDVYDPIPASFMNNMRDWVEHKKLPKNTSEQMRINKLKGRERQAAIDEIVRRIWKAKNNTKFIRTYSG
tara:strand:- start:1527 stop:1979 length:453 start_codon:yes stop_codon:yes gene_type:complete